MNVLSLFDGLSGAQIALDRLGIKVDNYFASEVDKYCIKVTQANYPNTIQLGPVENVKVKDLPPIDLLIGGSPCQGFSVAGKGKNFNDKRSQLFFEFVRTLNEVKPKYFLLENVKMRKEYQDVISEEIGVPPILINSSLVSAQHRERLYWANMANFGQPKDKGIVLKDILENEAVCRLGDLKDYFGKDRAQLAFSPNGLKQIGVANLNGYDSIKRVYDKEGKSPTLQTSSGGHREPKIATNNKSWRKLVPLECERLQTIPDNYTNHVSNTQRYKMIGNAFTVDVIVHILSYTKNSALSEANHNPNG